MYKPLGLGCGHKFCTECVLRVVGVDGADLLQPLRRTLTNVPHGTACPQCRQRAVFYNAVELTKLGAFIYAKSGPCSESVLMLTPAPRRPHLTNNVQGISNLVNIFYNTLD